MRITFSEIAHATVDFTQTLFIILIVSIFAAVAQTCGPGHLFCDLRAFFTPEIIKLLFEFFIPFPGNQGRFHLVDSLCLFDLENLKIVDYSPQQEGKVFFGAWVEIENDDGVTHRFRIVGYDEIFGRKDYISIDSPMARALLKKEVGDLAVVNTPAGEASWYVNAIEYVKP